MVKSLGDYNKEKSSSSDLKNIVWSKKDLQNLDKPKTKNKKKISPTNNLPTKNKKTKESVEKLIEKDKEETEQTIPSSRGYTTVRDKKGKEKQSEVVDEDE